MATEQQRQNDMPKTSSGAKVTVACKLPHGIVIRPFKWASRAELVMGGGSRETKEAQPLGDEIVINGPARKLGEDSRCRVVAGYAITEGVDKDAWEQWLQVNTDSAMVKQRLIFAYEQGDKTIAAAKEAKGQKSGLEPLNPEGDLRVPKPPNKNLDKLGPDEDQVKRRA